ncbi:ferrichrome ABC transporter permease [Oligella sp. HMSC05A10]|uniref:FecCD family ABC transporter permease n=1 Tax=Oligella sp. HMSC05A10 TaxID=1581112 RepID=UPI0008A1F7A2|nr:ferrichrome ABC transporter permease [Oligella sp. HMSC05A10]
MRTSRSMVIGIASICTAVAVIFIGLMIGARPLTWDTMINALFSPDNKIDSIFVWTLRLPRSICAFMGGASLAVSGYLLQTLTRNPLAGPGLTGVTSGAVAAIVSCYIFFPKISSGSYSFIGLLGGLTAALMVFWITRGNLKRPLHLALAGISISLFFNAITTYLLISIGPQASSLLFWLTGGFQGRTWLQLAYMLPWVTIGIGGALLTRRIFSLMVLSDEAASSMGLRLNLWKSIFLVLAVILVAGVVPVAGPVAFVGLATPHIVRLLQPDNPCWSVILAASLGGLIATIADIIARSIAAPQELPISIIMALIGGPVFIYLIQKPNFSLNKGSKKLSLC